MIDIDVDIIKHEISKLGVTPIANNDRERLLIKYSIAYILKYLKEYEGLQFNVICDEDENTNETEPIFVRINSTHYMGETLEGITTYEVKCVEFKVDLAPLTTQGYGYYGVEIDEQAEISYVKLVKETIEKEQLDSLGKHKIRFSDAAKLYKKLKDRFDKKLEVDTLRYVYSKEENEKDDKLLEYMRTHEDDDLYNGDTQEKT